MAGRCKKECNNQEKSSRCQDDGGKFIDEISVAEVKMSMTYGKMSVADD